MNIKNGIFLEIASIRIKNGTPKLLALKYSLKATIIKLILDIVYNFIKIDTILSCKSIIIDILIFFISLYILLYTLLNLGKRSKIDLDADS
jgi:Na+/H+ antiporter NhaD/arsenite permease-like protein